MHTAFADQIRVRINKQDLVAGTVYTSSNLSAIKSGSVHFISQYEIILQDAVIEATGSNAGIEFYRESGKAENDNVLLKISGTSHIKADNAISLFPDPTAGLVNIQTANLINKVSVYSISGQQIMEVYPEDNQLQLNLSHLDAAVYYVRIDAATDNKVFKLIKK